MWLPMQLSVVASKKGGFADGEMFLLTDYKTTLK